ncbi:MAG: serine hydrolase [Armatimonadota bacterium]
MNQEFKKEVSTLIKGVKAKFGIAVTDLNKKNLFLYNADEVFPAASIIKIPILIELLCQVQKKKNNLKKRDTLKNSDKVGGSGVLQFMDNDLKPTVLDLAKLMIIISDNTATNMLIDILGMDAVNKMMRSLGIVKTVLGRKLHIDPKALTSKNFATPRDIMILLEKIYDKNFMQPKYRDMALNILSEQQYNDKISADFPEDVKFAHKTGEINSVRSDAGIVLNKDNPFIIVVLTKNVENIKKVDQIISKIGLLALKFWGR